MTYRLPKELVYPPEDKDACLEIKEKKLQTRKYLNKQHQRAPNHTKHASSRPFTGKTETKYKNTKNLQRKRTSISANGKLESSVVLDTNRQSTKNNKENIPIKSNVQIKITENDKSEAEVEVDADVVKNVPSERLQPRMTISRSSSRKTGSSSTTLKSKSVQLPDSDTDSEADISRRSRELTNDSDVKKVDIFDEKAWDTDLEPDDTAPKYDHSGKTTYLEACKYVEVIPVSYYLRHMQDDTVNLSHHGLAADGMKAIAMSLVSNTEITDLNLADNWLGFEGSLAVCQMLKENCYITHLNLSDNHLDIRIAETLANTLILNNTLKHVNMSGNDFDDRAAVYFANTIMNTKTLESINMSKNNFGESAGVAFGPAISENSCIKELDLSWNNIRRRGAVSVAMGLKTNVFMKKLNLSWNGFGIEGAFAMGDALRGNSVLEELDISNNRINTEGAVVLAKGVAVNETLKVLKMGQNPMQSAGCWGICAAILKNPNCILEELDFTDILVNNDFNEIFAKVQEQLPELKMRHGGMEPPLKPKARVHPMVKLHSYIQKNNLRLVDFFNKFDKDKSMSVTHEEFLIGLVETGINLTEEETQQLLEELDMDGDGEINYSELVIGHTDFQEKERMMNSVITNMRPVTS